MDKPKIPAVRVLLYEEQCEEIKASSIWHELCEASDVRKPGFLCAQVFDGEMRVFFIDHDRAMKFQELMGQEIGRTNRGKEPR